MKRVLSVILSLVLLLSLIPVSALAAEWTEGAPEITLTASELQSDNTMSVTIGIGASNQAIKAYQFGLIYDTSMVEVDSSKGERKFENEEGEMVTIGLDSTVNAMTDNVQTNVARVIGENTMFFLADARNTTAGFTRNGFTTTMYFKLTEEAVAKGGLAVFKLDDTLFEVGTGEMAVTNHGTSPVSVAIPIKSVALTGSVTTPTKGGTDESNVTGENVDVDVTWSPALLNNKFAASTVYTATITVSPKTGYLFAEDATVTLAGYEFNKNESGDYVATKNFDATAEKELTGLVVTGYTGGQKTAGETVSKTELTVKATYDDGSVDENYATYDIVYADGGDALRRGDTSITVQSGGKTATYDSIPAVKGLTATEALFTFSAPELTYNTEDQMATVKGAAALKSEYAGKIGTPTYTVKQSDSTVAEAKNAGSYDVYVSCAAGTEYDAVTDLKLGTVTINPKTVTATVTVSPASYEYTGIAITPTTVTVMDGTDVIPESEYTLDYSNNTAYGTATVTVTDKTGGNYVVSGTGTFAITKKAPVFTTAPAAVSGLTYDGTDQALITAGETADGTIGYKLTESAEYSAAIPTGKNAGTYKVYYKITGDANHSDLEDSISVTIAKAKVTAPTVSEQTYTYNGSEQTYVFGSDGDSDQYTVSNNIRKDAGSQTVTVTLKDPDNTKWASELPTYTFTIEKADAEITTAPKPVSDLTYTGSSQQLVTAGVSSHGTFQYSSSENGTYSEGIPTGTDAGNYTVWYKVKGDANHKDTAPVQVEMDIARRKLSEVTINAIPNQTFNGSKLEPELTVTFNGMSLVKGKDYTVQYTNNINAGNATADITGIGNYQGLESKKFTVDQAAVERVDLEDSRKYTATYGSLEDTATAVDANSKQETATITWYTDDTYGTVADDSATFATSANINGKVTLYYKATGMTNHNDYSGSVEVTITDKDTITNISFERPVTNPVYDGQPIVAGTDFIGASADGVTGAWTYSYKTASDADFTGGLPTNAGTYTIKASYEDAEKKGEKTISLTIDKASLTKPTVSGTYTYTGAEQTVTLDNVVAGKMTVTNNKRTNAGSQNVTVALTDKANYQWVGGGSEDLSLSWTIAQVTLTPTSIHNVASKEYDGNTTVTAKTGSSLTVRYTKSSPTSDDPTITVTPDAVKPIWSSADVGTNTVKVFTPYMSLGEDNVNFKIDKPGGTHTLPAYESDDTSTVATITKETNTWTVEPAISGWSYGSAPVKPSGTAKRGTVTYTYYSDKACTQAITLSSATDAGTYWMKAAVAESATYTGLEKVVPFVIDQAAALTVAPITIPVYFGTTEKQTIAVSRFKEFNGVTDAAIQSISEAADTNDIIANPAEDEKSGFTLTPALTKDSVGQEATLNVVISSKNYKDSTAVVTVKLVGKTAVTVKLANKTITYGDDYTPAATATAAAGFTPVADGFKYSFKAASAEDSAFTDVQPTTVGTYTIKVVYEDTQENGGVPGYYGSTTATLTINQKKVGDDDVIIADIIGQTYTGEAKTPDLTVSFGEKTLVKDTDYTVVYTNNTDAGTATATATITGTGNYTGTKTKNFTIAKADATVTVPTANTLTYTGDEQELVIAGSTTGGTLQYSLSENGAYGTAIPKGADAKDYEVWYKVVGGANYNDTTPKKVPVTISAKNVGDDDVTIAAISDKTYTGEAQTPDLTVSFGSKPLVKDTNYTVQYTNNTNAGKATATITGKGNYTGTKSVNFTIKQAAAKTLADKEVSHKFTLTGEQTVSVAGLVEGATKYTMGTATGNTEIVSAYSVDADGVVKYTLTGNGKATQKVTLPVTITSTNYADSTVKVVITLTEKDPQAALTINSGTTVTYGQTLTLSTTGGSGTGAVSYSVTNGTGEATVSGNVLTPVKAGTVTVTATKASDADYNEVTSEAVTITINKATPAGQPAYTKITTSGKTLADAALDNGTIAIEGSIRWVDAEGNPLDGTTAVTANTAYRWVFTPDDPDNYETLNGSITPYVVHSSSGGSGSSSYSITVESDKNGTVTVSPKSARKGTTVTITVKPDEGFELDTLRVYDKDGNKIKVTEGKNGKYTFTMPASKVTVKAAFEEIESAWPFVDVAEDFWARDAIAWAYENGYMNGNSATTFNPGGSVTRQQLWMILARLSGERPASMAEAKVWAVENGISDGSNPGNVVSRQQMVTILYRYAHLMGYKTSGSAALDIFPDSAKVAPYAQDAMAWSVANGIVGGTTQGTLNPGGTANRAQFATILQRFCKNIVED